MEEKNAYLLDNQLSNEEYLFLFKNASIPPSLSVASRKFLDRKKADEKKEMEGRKVQLMVRKGRDNGRDNE